MRSSKKSPVAERWVINASPVIALSRVGQVELLVRLPQQSAIPRSVADELLRGPQDDPARRAVDGNIFKIIETPAPPAQILAWDLGQGETAVLTYALAHPKWVAVLDDGAARRCARSLSLTITGTLAVVLLAKQHGLIESAARVLHDLRSADFHLDDKTIQDALERTVGEIWVTGK
jgi:predicted nucleic acid-binding protein